MGAWYTYPRIDQYGSPDPYGGFPKPDSNILCPEGTAATAPLAGIVSGINAPGGILPSWGAVVTVKLTTPYNAIADHYAFLHLAQVVPGLSVGTSVSVGDVLGVGGSGPNAAGLQKAPLGFAFIHDDYYGYGPNWSKYNGSSQLNPVPFLDSLAGGGAPVSPPPTGGGGGLPPAASLLSEPFQTVKVVFSPNDNVTQWLQNLDQLMLVLNPFPTSGVIPIGGTSIPDPIGWLTEVGSNMYADSVALGLRLLFITVGGWLILRVLNEFIDYGALLQSATTVIGAVA